MKAQNCQDIDVPNMIRSTLSHKFEAGGGASYTWKLGSSLSVGPLGKEPTPTASSVTDKVSSETFETCKNRKLKLVGHALVVVSFLYFEMGLKLI